MAHQFDDKVIIPLAINGYDVRSEYHHVFETIIGKQVSAIDLMDVDGFSKLINSINEYL